MELTPQQLCEVEFSEQWRGYSRDQVDDFIERVAAAVSTLQERLRAMTERAVRAEQRALEGSEADGAARRTLVLAQRTADATIAEAKETAARLIAQAQEEARAIVLAAEASAQAIPAAEPTARAEIADLEVTRSRLQANVASLEAHVNDNRTRIKGLLDELQLRVDQGLETHIAQWPRFDDGRVLVDDIGAADDGLLVDLTHAVDEEELDDGDESAFEFAPPPVLDAEAAYEPEPEPEPEPEFEPEPEPEPEFEAELEAPSPQWQPVAIDWEAARGTHAPAGDEDTREAPEEPAVRVPSHRADEFPSHEVDDDTFFAELRGALDDDAPLGPRDDAPGLLRSPQDVATAVADVPSLYDQGGPEGRKFGLLKRRKRRQA